MAPWSLTALGLPELSTSIILLIIGLSEIFISVSSGVGIKVTGSIKDFYDASNFVSTIENRQGMKIACLEEIALNNKWINKKDISESIKFYGNCEYSKYLISLIK